MMSRSNVFSCGLVSLDWELLQCSSSEVGSVQYEECPSFSWAKTGIFLVYVC